MLMTLAEAIELAEREDGPRAGIRQQPPTSAGRREIMKALSIRQPWAWLIVNGYKDVENRSWWTSYRGEFLVHASQCMTRDEYGDAFDTAMSINESIPFPRREELARGGIVGAATLSGVVTRSDSPWFMGDKGFMLRDQRPTPFVPFKGQLGFFDVAENILRTVRGTA